MMEYETKEIDELIENLKTAKAVALTIEEFIRERNK